MSGQAVIGGRYRLLEELGRGGMGVVRRAHDERLERDVALKVLHPWVADDAELAGRFRREAEALARLEHPNVVRLYDVVDVDGAMALVLELIEGRSLAEIVRGRRLPWEQARLLCAPVATALAYAHGRGVVHRDLTPSNVLVERSTGRVVVSDFGLARIARSSASAITSHLLAGTPEYWSPEQAAGERTGAATDVYSLGCVLYRLVAGVPPFQGEDRLAAGLRRTRSEAPTLAAVVGDAPAEAEAVVATMLRRDPRQRPSAGEAAARLGALDGEPTLAGSPVHRAAAEPVTRRVVEPVTVRAGRPRRARRRFALIGAVAAGAIAFAGGGVYAVASQAPPGIDAPDLRGAQLAKAKSVVRAAANDEGVEAPGIAIWDRAYSETVAEGAVLSQDPAPGEHVASTGAVRVRLSLGTAWAEIPYVSGQSTPSAARSLADAGFTPTRRYAPSVDVPAWHVIETTPGSGERVKRPATVTVLVSTGPPRVPLPPIAGLDVDDAADALEDAGFAVTVEEQADTTVEPGLVLRSVPASGRAPLGSTVTLVVAREPRWETVAAAEGSEPGDTGTLAVPAGARVVIRLENTSFLGLFDGSAAIGWSGDESGSIALDAPSETVLVESSGSDRSIAFRVEAIEDAAWTIVVERVG